MSKPIFDLTDKSVSAAGQWGMLGSALPNTAFVAFRHIMEL